jgi:transcription termination/antitermination protein NusG
MSDTPENLASNDAAPLPIDDGPMPVRPLDAADEPDQADEPDETDEAHEPVEREADVVEVPEAPEIEEPPFEPADPTLRIGEAGPASDDPQGGQVEVLSAEEPEPELPSTIDAIGTGPTDRVVVQVDQEEPVIPPAEEETASDRTVEAPLEESESMPVEEALEAATVPLEDQAAEALTEPDTAEPELNPSAEEPAAPEADVAAAVAEAPAEGEAAPAASDPFRGPGDWYVVHTYAGYENKVKANLESRIHTMQMEDKIFNVHIPMEDVMEIKGGKKQVVQRKVFPGYLLVKMEYDNDSWYVVRNTPGVTGFVAAGTGSKPTPLSRREVEKILAVKKEEVKPQFRLGFEEGDIVRIVSGPFADFNGTISEINVDQSKLKVLVNIFDRETPVELGFDQVAKV